MTICTYQLGTTWNCEARHSAASRAGSFLGPGVQERNPDLTTEGKCKSVAAKPEGITKPVLYEQTEDLLFTFGTECFELGGRIREAHRKTPREAFFMVSNKISSSTAAVVAWATAHQGGSVAPKGGH